MCNFWNNIGAMDIADNCKVIGVLPALPNTYRVYGYDIEGDTIELGYEYPGAEHPDWVEELKFQRIEMAKEVENTP